MGPSAVNSDVCRTTTTSAFHTKTWLSQCRARARDGAPVRLRIASSSPPSPKDRPRSGTKRDRRRYTTRGEGAAEDEEVAEDVEEDAAVSHNMAVVALDRARECTWIKENRTLYP